MRLDILNNPSLYLLSQKLVGAKRARKHFIEQFVRPRPGSRILDIGCGPAYVLEYLPEAAYIGFDTEPRYIQYAKRIYGSKGEFYCQRFDRAAAQTLEPFDAVLMVGIIHHLSDQEALELFSMLPKALKPGGQLFALEPCYMPKQSPIAKFIFDRDRGKHVRPQQAYIDLARSFFDDVTVEVRHDLLNIPYTLVMLKCLQCRGAGLNGYYENANPVAESGSF